MKTPTPDQRIKRLQREVAELRSRLNWAKRETDRRVLTRISGPGAYFLGAVDAARTLQHVVEIKRDGNDLVLEAVRREPA